MCLLGYELLCIIFSFILLLVYCLFAILAELAPYVNSAIRYCSWHLLLAIWRLPVVWPVLLVVFLILGAYIRERVIFFISPSVTVIPAPMHEGNITLQDTAGQAKQVARIIMQLLLMGSLHQQQFNN